MKNVIARTRLFELYVKDVEIEGKHMKFEYVRRPAGVRVVVPNFADGSVLLTRELREEAGGWDYRLPGGKVFDSLDDEDRYLGDIAVAATLQAANEVEQECGVRVADLVPLRISRCGATIEWTLYYFEARQIVSIGSQALEVGERIEPEWVAFDRAFDLAMSGAIQEDRSAAVLFRWLNATAARTR